jgi:hypothetical protein
MQDTGDALGMSAATIFACPFSFGGSPDSNLKSPPPFFSEAGGGSHGGKETVLTRYVPVSSGRHIDISIDSLRISFDDLVLFSSFDFRWD